MTVQVIADPPPANQLPEPPEDKLERGVPASVRRRLEPMRSSGWRSWAVAAWVVVIAAILRFVKLGFPPQLVFDEVYYAPEGQDLLDFLLAGR